MTARAGSIDPFDAAAGDGLRAVKIVVASSGLGHVARGVEAWAADLGAALHRRGLNVTLCKGGGEAVAPYERVIPCWRRDSGRARGLRRLVPASAAWRLGISSGYGIEQVTFALGLIRYLRRERVDLLHVQDPQLALMVQQAHRLGWIPTRTILAHGTEEPAEFLKKITYVQHLAPWHERQCREEGAFRDNWTSIPNFIDTKRFQPGQSDALRAELGIPQKALIVLTAAAIKREHKRVDALLWEFSLLRAAHPALLAWLVVAGGEEPETAELIEQGQRMLGDRVRFLVRFPRHRMPELYRSADLFVLSSLKEMMPIALLEATASGLPCIVNRHPVLEWMAGPGGESIEMGTDGALASSLGALLHEEQRRRHLGKQAHLHCLHNFSESAVVDQILGYYQTVLADGVHEQRPFIPAALPAPTVGVVIPAFNSARWVTQAVESVLAQTHPPAQIIVVDDGSTDDTRQLLANFQDRVTYIHQQNQGVAVARNVGISHCTGDLVAFLDADDVWHPRKLELQVAAMAADPEFGLLGTSAFPWPDAHLPDVKEATPRPIKVPWRRLVVRNRFTTSSIVVRRRVLEEVGGFDPELRGPEDYDLWLRIAERAPVANLTVLLVGYRNVPGSLSQRSRTMEKGLDRILQKLDDRQAWRGRWLLRRKAKSHHACSCAYIYRASGDDHTALLRLLDSLTSYPLPYLADARLPLVRLRMLTKILLRSLCAPAKPQSV